MEKSRVYQSQVNTGLSQLAERAEELTIRHSVRENVQLTGEQEAFGVIGLTGINLCFVRSDPKKWTLDLDKHTVIQDNSL
ncbi:hypothetical protein [Spirosoma rhododendri]|uniref:Uncharacterized protein n=1 Tax=Spirosoma rhododendri TaxID=2728024 RepID=A0A7L5DM87_9BACT|nr:hypothetical protein [Spirosoma rhododendri]QJD79579.1 hypothetical protein HH216_15010 [Spirosoma rhododendri]